MFSLNVGPEIILIPQYIYISRVPEAAAPQTTPQTNGGQVTGFVS